MNFFIPKTTKIFGHTIRISLKKDVFFPGSQVHVNGLAYLGKNIIEIRKDMYHETQEQTYLHEITHHILFYLEKHKWDTEKFVQGFSLLLHQFIKTGTFINDSFIPSSFMVGGIKYKIQRIKNFDSLEKKFNCLFEEDSMVYEVEDKNIIYVIKENIDLDLSKNDFSNFSVIL